MTLGADFIDKEFTHENFPELKEKDKLTITLWDLAGQSHFEDIASIYIQGSVGIILVFDVNNLKSFNDLIKWKKICDQSCIKPIYLAVGNKSDLNSEIPESEIKAMEKTLDVSIDLVSAKLALNVNDIFEKMAKKLLTQFFNKYKEKEKKR
jgi:small GTP-binding protein